MNFTEQPTGRTGHYSPIMYQVFDANFALAGFYYEMEVYVWSGSAVIPGAPVRTVNVKADQFGAGRGRLDVAKIVGQYTQKDVLIDGTYQPNILEGAQYVAIKATAIWDASSSVQITSNVQLITPGYNYTEQGLNADWASKVIYTDRNTIYITENTPSFYLWFDADSVTSIDVGAFNQPPNVVVDSNEKIQGIDIVQLMANAALTGTDSVITFTDGATNPTINLVYECENKYGTVTVHYLNRYGIYESFVFNALSRTVQEISKKMYQQPIYKQADLNEAFTYGVGIDTSYLVNAKRSRTVNTNYLTQEYNEIIQQIFYSRNMLLVDGTDVFSVRVRDSAFNEKTRVNDKLIQYTIGLNYNQPVINDIAR